MLAARSRLAAPRLAHQPALVSAAAASHRAMSSSSSSSRSSASSSAAAEPQANPSVGPMCACAFSSCTGPGLPASEGQVAESGREGPPLTLDPRAQIRRPLRALPPSPARPDRRGDCGTLPRIHPPLPHVAGGRRTLVPAPELGQVGAGRQGLCRVPTRQGAPAAPRQACRGQGELALRVVERDGLLWLAGSGRPRCVSSLPLCRADSRALSRRGLTRRSDAGVNYFYSHKDDRSRRTGPSRAAGLLRALLYFRRLAVTCALPSLAHLPMIR